MIKYIYTILFILHFFVCTATSGILSKKVQVIFNDEYKSTIKLQQVKSTDYISLRDIANLCNAKLSWYRISGKVIFSVNIHQICFYFNSNKAVVDTKRITLPKATFLTQKDLYVPVEFFLSKEFSKLSDYKIQFDSNSSILFIEKVVNMFSPRIYTEKSLTKVSIELLEKLPYDMRQKSDKEYLFTLYKAKAVPEKIDFENNYIKQIEIVSKDDKVTCKLKLNLLNLNIKHYYKENPIRLIIEIFPPAFTPAPIEVAKLLPSTTPTITVTPITAPASATATDLEARPEPNSTISSTTMISPSLTALPASTRSIRIVLDPGHGGEDPGAVGPNSTKEKDINLAIAKELARLLKEDNYEVFLTREDDVFVPLVDRTQFANDKKADVFVSIHCNASIKKDTRGFEIYFLSETASDPEAEAVAARENAVIKLEKKPTKKQEHLQQLLWSMVVNEFMNEASELCSFITQEVTRRQKIENRGIKQAGFYVLRGAQMPAVLVECDFISHKTVELKLRSLKVQKQFADSIYSGIKQYVDRKNLLANKKL
ncbi:MAG: N-acetylmuramoyl-L-alanine amidase [Elusimicrobiota bacterium]|nr:N-acetylmuramoyl-L-alanine amidase [Elusimicrobiota bacterium]